MKSNSWIIIEKATGKAVAETYNESTLEYLKPEFKAVTAYDYLVKLNQQIKQETK